MCTWCSDHPCPSGAGGRVESWRPGAVIVPWTSSAADIPPAHISSIGVTMSNHFSADNLRYSGDDTRLDLTDVFAFRSEEDPAKTVLIMDSNPTIRPPDGLPQTVVTSRDFHPGAVYRINIDDDGDAQADTAFTFTFSEPAD